MNQDCTAGLGLLLPKGRNSSGSGIPAQSLPAAGLWGKAQPLHPPDPKRGRFPLAAAFIISVSLQVPEEGLLA